MIGPASTQYILFRSSQSRTVSVFVLLAPQSAELVVFLRCYTVSTINNDDRACGPLCSEYIKVNRFDCVAASLPNQDQSLRSWYKSLEALSGGLLL